MNYFYSRRLSIVAFVCVATFIFSCKKDKEKEDDPIPETTTNISSIGATESHNNGQNCINCHISGGQGKGIFIVAGSVFDSLQTTNRINGTVTLYSGINGTGSSVATLYVDGKGNFYTTENINFSNGLFPIVKASNGDIRYMPSSVSTGQCNSCHGVNVRKIWVK